MANEIKLITYINSEVTSTDDAYVYEVATGEGGVIDGCAVTIKNASELHITGGNGILCGRKFTIFDSDIPVTLSSSGTILGRLYIHMDLSNSTTPIQLMIETGASLTPVQQDADVNATNGIYEVNLATFDVDTSTLSNLVDVAPKTGPHTVLNTIEDCVASTNPNDIAGASCISLLNSNITANVVNSTYIDISGYDINNKFECPCDGYVQIGANNNTSRYEAVIEGGIALYVNGGYNSTWNITATFVRKGMKVYATNKIGSGQMRFFKLENAT